MREKFFPSENNNNNGQEQRYKTGEEKLKNFFLIKKMFSFQNDTK